MMTHHLSVEDVTAYLDGECTEEEFRYADSHLNDCAECRKLADDQQFVKALMSAFEEPALPRSFRLPEDKSNVTPLHSPTSSVTKPAADGNIRRFESIARLLSIAAVIALLVLGGAQMAGVGDSDSTDPNNITLNGETNQNSSALNDQEPALERGEVREQGESAAAGINPLGTTNTLVDTPAQATDNGLTSIEITTIGVGIVALASIASWILIHYRAGESSN